MGETLEALHRLQTVELQLAEIRRTREAKARRVEYHQRQAEKADQQFQGNQLAARELQIRLDALQLDATAREDSISSHRQALNKAKTNREYAAILTALNTEKADNAKLETKILQLMEEVQTHKDEAATKELEKNRLLDDVARAEETLRAYDRESKERRDDLQAKRDECAATVAPSALASFNRVAEYHEGEAMVPISKLHPKRDDYVCSGCNMQVALEVINSLQMRDEIQVCLVCGRLLYLETPQKQRTRA